MSAMKVGSVVIKRRVVVAAVGVAMGIASWYAWSFRPSAVIRTPAPAPTPVLQLTGRAAGDLLREQAEYFDPTPLFFPTSLNYGQGRPIGALGREPSEGFVDYAPDFRFTEKLAAYGLSADPAPQRPEDLLTFADESPFAGIGRTPLAFPRLQERRGFVEVKSLKGGVVVLRQTLQELSLPVEDFAPVEFLLLIGANGVVGEPLITTNSGLDQVDSYLREYLVKSYRIGERLPPGKYAVSVGR